jgi:nucleoside-diphosphate-sugar epimerase|tara:strand:- start:169 stop:1056 length:888 start_codon:yes stop_codon:yes gene_type:complete
MNIALTGASGFIGSAVAKLAAKHGHAVKALVRETSKREHIEQYVDEFVVGKHDDENAIALLLDGTDVVIHDSFDWSHLKDGNTFEHLQSNLLGSINLLGASKDRHFIYMSSIAVHHHMHENWNGSIDSTHPTRPGSLYGACKASIEAHMWAANASRSQRVTAMRPCAVYGIDPIFKRSIGYPIVRAMQEGKAFTKLGGGKFVHVDDVASATIAAIGNESASPSVYNLVDCYARWADWAAIASKELGIESDVDFSSPEQPKNSFDISTVENELGVSMNRGIDGIRTQIQDILHASE